MEITFNHLGYPGRVTVTVERTVDPAIVGAHDGAISLANCKATIEFEGRGYLQLFGWVQLVRSTDNAFQGEAFEMDPFDPFQLCELAPTPYCCYGVLPTLFDAPSRDERVYLDWVAHSFMAVSPSHGNRRVVTPLLGFSWGFRISDQEISHWIRLLLSPPRTGRRTFRICANVIPPGVLQRCCPE